MACCSSTPLRCTAGRVKRSLSDSDEDSSLDDSSRFPSQSDDDGYVSLSRKKRRGIIEKRRRDRINNCLAELRRLVPQAFEKQNSQKLEKAEILQMTVEHLRYLQAKGTDTIFYDPTYRYATDYQSMGFRECAAEVARYLSAVEGMDAQDPLRLRLLSHLRCYTNQKFAANITANNWNVNHLSQWNLPGNGPSCLASRVAAATVNPSYYTSNGAANSSLLDCNGGLSTSQTNEPSAGIAAASRDLSTITASSHVDGNSDCVRSLATASKQPAAANSSVGSPLFGLFNASSTLQTQAFKPAAMAMSSPAAEQTSSRTFSTFGLSFNGPSNDNSMYALDFYTPPSASSLGHSNLFYSNARSSFGLIKPPWDY